jgi:hypothetical protein
VPQPLVHGLVAILLVRRGQIADATRASLLDELDRPDVPRR